MLSSVPNEGPLVAVCTVVASVLWQYSDSDSRTARGRNGSYSTNSTGSSGGSHSYSDSTAAVGNDGIDCIMIKNISPMKTTLWETESRESKDRAQYRKVERKMKERD